MVKKVKEFIERELSSARHYSTCSQDVLFSRNRAFGALQFTLTVVDNEYFEELNQWWYTKWLEYEELRKKFLTEEY